MVSSQGPPLSPQGAALAGDDGVMRTSAARTILRCIARPRMLDAIEAECDAQIRWALDHGIAPTHLDSHRHIHGWPPVFARVAALARRYDIRFVRWHREVLSGPGWPAAPAGQRRVSRLLNLFGARNARIAADLRATGGTWGVAHTGRIDSRWLIQAARSVSGGAIEIMTHPGLPAGLDAGLTRLLESRRAEMQALCDPAVRDAFQRNGVELTHYGKL